MWLMCANMESVYVNDMVCSFSFNSISHTSMHMKSLGPYETRFIYFFPISVLSI